MSTNTEYIKIANDFNLWGEYVDTMGIDSLEDFEAMSEQEKIDIMKQCFEVIIH